MATKIDESLNRFIASRQAYFVRTFGNGAEVSEESMRGIARKEMTLFAKRISRLQGKDFTASTDAYDRCKGTYLGASHQATALGLLSAAVVGTSHEVCIQSWKSPFDIWASFAGLYRTEVRATTLNAQGMGSVSGADLGKADSMVIPIASTSLRHLGRGPEDAQVVKVLFRRDLEELARLQGENPETGHLTTLNFFIPELSATNPGRAVRPYAGNFQAAYLRDKVLTLPSTAAFLEWARQRAHA